MSIKTKVASAKLIYQCANLLRNELSFFAEDWPKTTPKKVLWELEKQANKQREIVTHIRAIIDIYLTEEE